MNRYNKVMEKVKVTPQMRERIVKNIQETEFDISPRKSFSFQDYKGYFSIAACLVVCMLGIMLVPNKLKVEQDPPLLTAPNIVEYTSRAELSSAVGFDVKEVREVPFEIEHVEYVAFDQMAQITYVGKSDSLSFRMAESRDDISGDYNVYEDVKVYTLDDRNITIKGNDSLYYLAVWEDDKFSYALQLENAISEEELMDIIQPMK